MAHGEQGRRVPSSIQNHLGNGKLEKGRWTVGEGEDQSFYLMAWDFAKECTDEDCPLYHLCEYRNYAHMNKNHHSVTTKCMLHQRYLKNVLHAVVEKMKRSEDFNQESVIKLGYQMLPLYDQLFKFKMWEYNNEQLVYVSEKGTPKVHPVYKEIREIIKTISGIWRELGGVDKKNADPKGIGDRSFIDAVHSVGGEAEAPEPADGEGTGMDFSQSTVDEKPKKKDTRKKKRKKKVGGNRKRKSTRDPESYYKRGLRRRNTEQNNEDEE